MTADSLSIDTGGIIELNTFTEGGNAGQLSVVADTVEIANGGTIRADTVGDGSAGEVLLTVNRLDLVDGGSISTKSLSAGDGGTITINAADSVSINGSGDNGPSGLFSNAFSSGNGGAISVSAPDLQVANKGKIQAGVAASTDVEGLPPATSGTVAGEINIQVDRLTVSGKGQISTQSENAGQAGNITIAAADQVTLSSPSGGVQSGIFSTASGSGSGGSITITGGKLSMNGGAINVSSNSSGDAGQVDVAVDQLAMTGGSQISTASDGSGDAGALRIAASGDVSVSGEDDTGFQTGLYSLAQGSGKGGDIGVSGASVTVAGNGLITAESSGSGDAGAINVAAVDAVTLTDGAITTQAVTADGGNIKVTAERIVYLLDSRDHHLSRPGFWRRR